MLGVTTSMQYSAAHPSPMNKAFVEGFKSAGKGIRPDHIGLAVYDALHLIYAAIRKTGGNTNGDALIAAVKAWLGKARAGRARSIRKPARWFRTCIFDGSKGSMANSTMSSSRSSRLPGVPAQTGTAEIYRRWRFSTRAVVNCSRRRRPAGFRTLRSCRSRHSNQL